MIYGSSMEAIGFGSLDLIRPTKSVSMELKEFHPPQILLDTISLPRDG